MGKKSGFLLWIVSVFFLVSACTTVVVQQAPEPKAEWVPVKITGKGQGAPPANAANQAQARLLAERAAKMDAMRNLAEQVKGVKIRGTTTVKDFVTQDDTIRARVDAYLRGARVVNTTYQSDGAVEVEVEIDLGYEFRRIFP